MQFVDTYLSKYPVMGRLRFAQLPWNRERRKRGEVSAGELAAERADDERENISPDWGGYGEEQKSEGGDATTTSRDAAGRAGRGKGGEERIPDSGEAGRPNPPEWFRPKPFQYSPEQHLRADVRKELEERREKARAKGKGRCPMRAVSDAAIVVYDAAKKFVLALPGR